MTTILIIIIAAICFFAVVLNLAVEHKFRNRIMSICFTTAVLSGLLLYGYGYAYMSDSIPIAIIDTIMAVCKMFGGSNALDDISAAPLFAHRWVIVVFSVVHFMAFYAMASTVAATIGKKVLRRIRITLLRRGTLLVIYGVNGEALEYGKRQINVLKRSTVFIGQADAAMDAAINAVGGVLESNGEHPDDMLLRKLGIRPGKRHIEIAALHEDGVKNFIFARELLQSFEKAGVIPEQTMLLMRNVDEDQAGMLVASGNQYGYGSTMAFNAYELAARLMVQQIPPCETISFDENACAQEDFGVLMVGFGRMGRAALEALLMNGQFCGSTFRADIFDENAQNGMLYDHELFRHYDVRFHKAGGKSDAIYAFLNERKKAIRYIVVCTGNDKENREIAHDLGGWLRKYDVAPAIVECTGRGLAFVRPGENECVYQSIYSSDVLALERIDRMAMAINHAYCRDSGKTPQENWKDCDYFSRMSSRASADFYPAILKAAGKTMQQVKDGNWPPHEASLENLAITEHLRWCAFHYVMGFHPMSEADYARRVEQYRQEIQQKGASSLRISKDMKNRKHACLIPWDDLDQLSASENAVTGGHVDYKQMDRNNILVLPDILNVLYEMNE